MSGSTSRELVVTGRGLEPGALEAEIARGSRPTRSRIAIVGLGAWGLAVLERLVSVGQDVGPSGGAAAIHVIEPNEPGFGVYSTDLPDYVIMNTPCGQISMYPGIGNRTRRRHELSLFEWATREGYTWHGDQCRMTSGGHSLAPSDFLPRALVGRYLVWYFDRLRSAAPPWIRIQHHRSRAVDVVSEGGAERVVLASGDSIQVDHVVLTLGHVPNSPKPGEPHFVSYSSVFAPDFEVAPGAVVAVAGMGLAATDVVMALTRGRGGRFASSDGRLTYSPSGKEPQIRLYSRSGLPQAAKASGMPDLTTVYRAGIWTDAAMTELTKQVWRDGRSGHNWQHELYPLLAGEMTLQYYVQAARNDGGPQLAAETRNDLVAAWEHGEMERAVASLAPRLGAFDPDRHFFPDRGVSFVQSRDYEEFVRSLVANDLREAMRPGGSSPIKMAYEVLRFVRDGLRRAIDFGGLEEDSHREFFSQGRGRINRLVQGPPASRMQQLLALSEAGVVTYPYGPSPALGSGKAGGLQVQSTQLGVPHVETTDLLICGYLADPALEHTASPLVTNLRSSGRLATMAKNGRSLGCVNLNSEAHPIAADGTVQETLWLFGAMTEGARYFTNVIPSPGSRVGPFQEADRLARGVLVRT